MLRGPEHLLSAFEILRKSTITFVMSVRLSVLPSALNNSAPTGRILLKFRMFGHFSEICRENSSFIKVWQELRALYMKTDARFDHISLSSSLNEKCFIEICGGKYVRNLFFFFFF